LDPIKDSPQSFDPCNPAYRYKLWKRVVTAEGSQWHLYWRRIFLLVPVLLLTGLFATAGGLWYLLKFKRGFTEASYLNLALPWRWPQHRIALGHHYFADANKEWSQQHYLDALNDFRAAMVRLPADLSIRRQLTLAYLAFGRVDLALRTLIDGEPMAQNDFDYQKLVFSLLSQMQEDERAIALARQWLPAKPDNKLIHQYIALQAATAHYYRGRYDQAEHIIDAWGLARMVEGQLLIAKADWERGYTDLALFRLAQEISRSPQCDDLNIQLVRCYRELGRHDEARQHALLRHFNDPVSPGPRIDLIYAYNTDNARAAAREIETYLSDFGGDPAALLLLAWFGADADNIALVRRVHALARAHNDSLNGFNLALVQAELGAQNYAAALADADTALHEEKDKDPYFAPLLAGLRAIAFYGLRDRQRADLQLDSFLNRANFRANDALLLAKQLQKIGYKDVARKVLAAAVAKDHLNQAALSELIRIDVALGNRDAILANLPLLLAMRKSSHAVLGEALLVLDHPEDSGLCQNIRAVLNRGTSNPAPDE
jgi:hypothetical protein